MKSELNHIKGIHPGLVLNRELDKRNLRKGAFALSLQEYPQTITAITKGKRGMNTALSLKIEKALDIEEGYFMILQVFFEIEEEKRKLNRKNGRELSNDKLYTINFFSCWRFGRP